MAGGDTLTDADARYLEQIWDDCEECLGPDAELLDLAREHADDGVRLVARYRLGKHDRESTATGESLLAAHSALRARIVLDRLRFGMSDLIDRD
jgi:hypothetical protein